MTCEYNLTALHPAFVRARTFYSAPTVADDLYHQSFCHDSKSCGLHNLGLNIRKPTDLANITALLKEHVIGSVISDLLTDWLYDCRSVYDPDLDDLQSTLEEVINEGSINLIVIDDDLCPYLDMSKFTPVDDEANPYIQAGYKLMKYRNIDVVVGCYGGHPNTITLFNTDKVELNVISELDPYSQIKGTIKFGMDAWVGDHNTTKIITVSSLMCDIGSLMCDVA